MIFCSVHGAWIMNLAFDFIISLAARYRGIESFFACVLLQLFTGVLKHFLEFF